MKRVKLSTSHESLVTLYITFFRIGLFTFGGGYAMLPLLEKEVVEKHGWASHEDLLNYYAVSQSTPGIIAVNTATFIGMKFRGILGAIASTIGVVTPSWIIISVIAGFIQTFKDNPYISKGFEGIRVVVLALIIHSIITMSKKTIKSMKDIVLLMAGLILVSFNMLNPALTIILAGLLGLVYKIWEVRRYDTN